MPFILEWEHISLGTIIQEVVDEINLSGEKELYIDDLPLLYIPPFDNIEELCLDSCDDILVIPSMPKLKEIYLSMCSDIEIVRDSPNLKKLHAFGCRNLKFIPQLLKI